MTSPKEPVEGYDWTIMRSFDEFRNWVVENKKVPDLLCLDFELSESAYRWTLDGANEGVKFPYENQGIETTMKCLVFLWNVCNQNSLTMPEILIKTDYPQGRYDLSHFLELTAKQRGETANFRFVEMEITEDYLKEPNYKIYKSIESEISSKCTINQDIFEKDDNYEMDILL